MINDPEGHYAVLEVHPNASPALIRAAYRVRAMQLHPDRNESLSSTGDFQRLQAAFAVLGDPALRAAYDARAARSGMPPREQPARPPVAPAAPLIRRWGFLGSRFMFPAGLFALGVGAAACWIYVGADDAPPERPKRARPGPSSVVATPDELQLLALSRPLPSSGILQLGLPSDAFANPDRLPRLTLVAPRDANYLVKLVEWDSQAPAMSVFVRAGETTEVLVPRGRYRIRLASGSQWYGEALRFGPSTQYAQVDTMSEFQPMGDRVLRHELLLERFAGLDPASTRIAASSF